MAERVSIATPKTIANAAMISGDFFYRIVVTREGGFEIYEGEKSNLKRKHQPPEPWHSSIHFNKNTAP